MTRMLLLYLLLLLIKNGCGSNHTNDTSHDSDNTHDSDSSHDSSHSSNETFKISHVSNEINELYHILDDTYISHNNSGEWTCDEVETVYNTSNFIRLETLDFVENNCSSSHESSHHHDSLHSGHLPQGVFYILYMAFVLFLGCLLKFLQERFHIPLPYTVLLFGLGVILEIWEIFDPDAFGYLNEGFQDFRIIDPHMILFLFIPGLIFESAFSTDWHVFIKEFNQALLLAGPGVVINVVLTGGVMYYFAWSYEWSLPFCLMFGSIVSATDPVAVVSLLKTLGASKRLSTLIEAESLLNDGTAFVLFVLLQEYSADPSGTTFSTVLVSLLRLAIGGGALGILAGFVCYYSLSHVYDDFEIEISLTFSLAYLAFFLGDEVLGVSGVLTCVFMGVWVSKNRSAVSPQVEEALHHFWSMLGFLANTILFFGTGQIIAYRILNDDHKDILYEDIIILLILYIFAHIIRGVAIWILFPALKSSGYGCTLKDSIVMTYGGLRGAIGLALALIVETNSDDVFEQDDKDRVLFLVCGFVAMTLVINASTVKYVVQYLGLNKPARETAQLFKGATEHLREFEKSKLNQMWFDKQYSNANWELVKSFQPDFTSLYKELFGTVRIQKENQGFRARFKSNYFASNRDYKTSEVERRVIQIMKAGYWHLYEHASISRDAVNILVEAADTAMDNKDMHYQVNALKKFFKIQTYIKSMYNSRYTWIKKISERLLFSNLAFSIELAHGFIYSAHHAKEYAHVLKKNKNIDKYELERVFKQLHAVENYMSGQLIRIEQAFPEVHQAIQTSQAANVLLFNTKHEIDALFHKGYLDEAEHSRVMALCDESLKTLFHTSHAKMIKLSSMGSNNTDDKILIESPLFRSINSSEKKYLAKNIVQSKWFSKGNTLIKPGQTCDKIFFVVRGEIGVYDNSDGDSNQSVLLTTKKRGDFFDIYQFLRPSSSKFEENKHLYSFVVNVGPCHGVWLNQKLLQYVKSKSDTFWKMIWRYAALDVLKFEFKYELNNIFQEQIDNMDSIVLESQLKTHEPQIHKRARDSISSMRIKSSAKAKIYVLKGYALLLSGRCTYNSDVYSPPSLLTPLSIDNNNKTHHYTAIEKCIVLYIDPSRQRKSIVDLRQMKLNGSSTSIFDDDEKDSNAFNSSGSIDVGNDNLELQSYKLSPNNLPNNISPDMLRNLTKSESFEIAKHIISNYNIVHPLLQFNTRLLQQNVNHDDIKENDVADFRIPGNTYKDSAQVIEDSTSRDDSNFNNNYNNNKRAIKVLKGGGINASLEMRSFHGSSAANGNANDLGSPLLNDEI